MAFPRKLLNEGEDIVLDLRPHWWVLARPVAIVVVLTVLAVVARDIDTASHALPRGLAVLSFVALAYLLVCYLKWENTNFVLTTDRIVSRSGVISKQGREIPLERLNDISFHQSIFERILGAGDVMIESAGERGQETFADLPKPSRVQNVIYQEIERAKDRDADRMAGRRELSVPEQIEKLDELRQRGVISQAEFDAKKAQLLDRM